MFPPRYNLLCLSGHGWTLHALYDRLEGGWVYRAYQPSALWTIVQDEIVSHFGRHIYVFELSRGRDFDRPGYPDRAVIPAWFFDPL